MRTFLPIIGLCVLAACAPTVPESGQGVGFGDYDSYLEAERAREAELRGQPVPDGPVISNEAPETQTPGTAPQGQQVAIDTDNPGISRSQSFEVVSERETIESDAAKIRAQRELYEFAKPKPLPERDSKANVAQFALSTVHSVGEKKYNRSPFGGLSTNRRCARYDTPNDAQQAFLDAGGPRNDRLGLDPDGDGFACDWSPEVFRQMVE